MYLEKTALRALLGKPKESRSSKTSPTCAYHTPGERKGVGTFFHATKLTVVMFSCTLIIFPGRFYKLATKVLSK